jgi:hypothetical protein
VDKFLFTNVAPGIIRCDFYDPEASTPATVERLVLMIGITEAMQMAVLLMDEIKKAEIIKAAPDKKGKRK